MKDQMECFSKDRQGLKAKSWFKNAAQVSAASELGDEVSGRPSRLVSSVSRLSAVSSSELSVV